MTSLQVVDQANITESEQTESKDADDLKTDKSEEKQDAQSPRSPDQHTEKVRLLTYRSGEAESRCHEM